MARKVDVFVHDKGGKGVSSQRVKYYDGDEIRTNSEGVTSLIVQGDGTTEIYVNGSRAWKGYKSYVPNTLTYKKGKEVKIMGISWDYEILKEQELHGNNAYDTDRDFKSKSEATKHLKSMFKNYECESCGSRKLDGHLIAVDIMKTIMFKQHREKGFFGGEKFVDRHWKTVWRVKDIYVKKEGFGQARAI